MPATVTQYSACLNVPRQSPDHISRASYSLRSRWCSAQIELQSHVMPSSRVPGRLELSCGIQRPTAWLFRTGPSMLACSRKFDRLDSQSICGVWTEVGVGGVAVTVWVWGGGAAVTVCVTGGEAITVWV